MQHTRLIRRSPATLIISVMVLLFASSCGSRQKMVYFNNLPDTAIYHTSIPAIAEPTIQPGDVLRIKVNSLNPETNRLFNAGTLQTAEESRYSSAEEGNVSGEGYLVNADGFISFPVIGQIQLEGLTRDQARVKLVGLVGEYVKEPIINIRFSNFRITVVGEVKRPATFTVPNERINIIEALGLAGDLTEFGKRENVLLIRESEGQRTLVRLNLNDKETLNSPYFFLRQNDVLYVEPTQYRDPSGDRTLRILTAVFSGLTALGLFLQRII
ncbi:polysaccharide biosynthesis/export family protein [Parapedobacter tibetensis]|uniref:polysaccharide biosynthesis/export family protein n=1 Tax=Parapedobacter tibetensis TaxID=2972951 RepID=UPI00214DBDA4|nr:polysaccharide biosynthesis/export family protein [Parapedobacter tibetensis]